MNFDIILQALLNIFAHANPRYARAAQDAAHKCRSLFAPGECCCKFRPSFATKPHNYPNAPSEPLGEALALAEARREMPQASSKE